MAHSAQGNSSLGGFMGWVASERQDEPAWPTMASGVVECGMGQGLRRFFWQMEEAAEVLWQ
jgi:hypothetical protein